MSNETRGEMTFWDHLKELLSRLRKILFAFLISTAVVMLVPIRMDLTNLNPGNPFYQTITSSIISHLTERFLAEGVELIPLSFFAPLEVYVFISIIIGATFSLPVTAYELYMFLNPALYEHEKTFALKFMASFIGLFIFGLVLGYLYVVPLTLQTMQLFSHLMNLSTVYNFVEFFSLVGMILLICGLLFTFPIYIFLLVKVGIMETRLLTQNRKYLYGAILITIAIVDPDPSLITELLTFIPIVALTEISIFLSKRIEKNRELAGKSEWNK